MMICAESFYEHELKGKSSKEIIKVIGRLSRKIKELYKVCFEEKETSNIMYMVNPGPDVQLRSYTEYLERAVQALREVLDPELQSLWFK